MLIFRGENTDWGWGGGGGQPQAVEQSDALIPASLSQNFCSSESILGSAQLPGLYLCPLDAATGYFAIQISYSHGFPINISEEIRSDLEH